MPIKTIIGIDEVGRGPLAGPVTVCALSVPHYFDFSHFEKIKDSKKLSSQKREYWYQKIFDLKMSGALSFHVSSVSAGEIDTLGITHSIKKAIKIAIVELKADPLFTEVRLDGSLRAPDDFLHQITIIKGDEKEPVISAASIVAKVTRDRMMGEFALMYPGYGFEDHKGYGTKLHMDALKKLGLSEIHRRSFIH